MSKLIQNENKQGICLASPRAMTNVNMLTANNNDQKNYEDDTNRNIRKVNSLTNTNDQASLNNPESSTFNKIKHNSMFDSKNLKKAASFELETNSIPIHNSSNKLTQNTIQENENNNDTNNSKLLTVSRKLMSSKKCVFVYIFLTIVTVFTFIYSLFDLFYSLNKIPLIISEAILCIVMATDIISRIVLLVIIYNLI